VPLSFHLGYPRPVRALKAGPPMEAGLFCVFREPRKHHVLEQSP
jgi:hypothetical protein